MALDHTLDHTSDLTLDLEYVRSLFPQCADYPEVVFCSNAGGSFVAKPVIELLNHYNSHTRVQPYSHFTPSQEAGDAMDQAKAGWAAALSADVKEITLGPSTSANSYVMAQALGASWGPGDEIIICQQDHEANIGAWERKAQEQGATLRIWEIDPATGLLNPDDLYTLLNEHTRWVFFTQASNLMGTVNPVAEIAREVHERSGAKVCVDGVSYAPHHIPNVKALGVDIYMFSLYKVYGPHQGLLYVDAALSESLAGQGHYFNREDPAKRFNPAGPQHGQIAACQGVLDYLDALHAHHGGSAEDDALARVAHVHDLIIEQERVLAEPLLDYLDNSGKVQLLGKRHCRDGDRAPTVAFKPLEGSSAELAATLQADGIGTESGDFYAPRALEAMGIDPSDGVVRISLLHYNTLEEVERILGALERAL
jgi:cysteine desulfurase family protein (TIGR01976 family)